MNLRVAVRLASLGLASLVIGGCVVAGREECQPRRAAEGLWHEFVILAYPGPPLGEVNDARYREIAEAGIDVIVPGNGTFTPPQNLRAMNLAHAAGLRVIPMDQRLFTFAPKEVPTVDDEMLAAVVADYRDHPAFAGYTIKDEPSADLFPALQRLRDRLVQKDPGHEPFINLFPSYGSPTQLGFADFRAYVRHYLETVKPRVLSYDFYPLRERATVDADWFSDLAITREEARRVGIPLWVFMQSEGIKGNLRVPNRAEVFWQASTALAYGARGIGWFTYWTPAPDQGVPPTEDQVPASAEQHYGGMLDTNGVRTLVYDHVRAANTFLHGAGKALLDWDNAFVAHFQRGQMLAGGASPVVTVSGDDANVVVGTFQRQDRYRVLLANRSWEKPARFRLETAGKAQIVRLLTATDTNPQQVLDKSGHWQLEPGGAVLVQVVPQDSSP